MNPEVREHAASDDHVAKCTTLGQYLAIFNHCALFLSANDLFIPVVVWSSFSVQVSHGTVISVVFSLSHNVCSVL